MLTIHVIITYHREENFSDTTSSIQTKRLLCPQRLTVSTIRPTVIDYLFVSCVHWHNRIDHKRHPYFFINLLQLIANSDFDKRRVHQSRKRTIMLRIRHKGHNRHRHNPTRPCKLNLLYEFSVWHILYKNVKKYSSAYTSVYVPYYEQTAGYKNAYCKLNHEIFHTVNEFSLQRKKSIHSYIAKGSFKRLIQLFKISDRPLLLFFQIQLCTSIRLTTFPPINRRRYEDGLFFICKASYQYMITDKKYFKVST